MRSFEYGDREISKKEIGMAAASMIFGISTLTLPHELAMTSEAADGWMSILIGGGASILFCWVIAALASRFPGHTFLQYTTLLITKPVALVITFAFAVYFMFLAAIETRMIASISKLYLFDRTPMEVISLVFLLIVMYGVAGSSAALLRLNLLFLPIVIFIICLVLFFNVGFVEIGNLKPYFTTEWVGILQGAKHSIFSFFGYSILLFYISMTNEPRQASNMALYGISIPLVVYLFIYIMVIGILSNEVAQNLFYPTIEIAKEVQVPGEFFERFESIFFTIWIMTVFNTAAMALDVAIIAMRSVFSKGQKFTWILTLSPIVLLIAMQPQNQVEMEALWVGLSYGGVVLTVLIPSLLLATACARKVRGDG